MDEVTEEVGTLVAPMLSRRLFVCMSTPTSGVSADEEFAHLPEHLRYLIALEQRGALFAGGPFLESGHPGQRAMYILRAESFEEAQSLVDEEPMHQRGLRTYTLEEWMLNEGRITLHVDFSSQRGGVDGS